MKRARAVISVILLAGIAESSQSFMVHRDPSVIDLIANVFGGIVGIALGARLNIRAPELRTNGWTALAAATLAMGFAWSVWATSGDPLSAHGATLPGALEAAWTFDEGAGHLALDSSGHDLHGRFVQNPLHVSGVTGGAIELDGRRDYVSFGHSTAFRVVGSLTITAWIKSTSYPVDDAAIVSNLEHGGGFQLDTTVDKGPRTIGFKLFDPCENLMARYGATPLRLDTWYHVAGVYDAQAQTMDVYLNGERDNASLTRPVVGAHRSSRRAVMVGRRSDLEGFSFAGIIDEVRIYSLALTQSEIAKVMRESALGSPPDQRAITTSKRLPDPNRIWRAYPPCDWSSEREDARVPGAVAAFGALIAVAFFGFWPSGRPLGCLIATLLSGWLLLSLASSSLPPHSRWMFPLTSFAGGVSVVVSLRRRSEEP
jgi:hypothetical protein